MNPADKGMFLSLIHIFHLFDKETEITITN